jgi:hypothetical protein
MSGVGSFSVQSSKLSTRPFTPPLLLSSLSNKTNKQQEQNNNQHNNTNMSDEEKYHELYNLCEHLFCTKASFGDVQEWLDKNKDNQDLLIQAANYKNEDSYTPLHYLVMKKPPSELVKRILRLAPDSVEVKDNTYGCISKSSRTYYVTTNLVQAVNWVGLSIILLRKDLLKKL